MRCVLAAAVLVAAGPAQTVGLGPLTIVGTIDGPREGFMLDLINPEASIEIFVLYAIGLTDETPQQRVSILPAQAQLGPKRDRKVLVIADDLAVGETYKFRVCAERQAPIEGMAIHARVCSKLSAHRVG